MLPFQGVYPKALPMGWWYVATSWRVLIYLVYPKALPLGWWYVATSWRTRHLLSNIFTGWHPDI